MKILALYLAIPVTLFAQRPDFAARAYMGAAVDTFSAPAATGLLYANPQDAGSPRQRPVGGFGFEYRAGRGLWIAGLAQHGARSAEVASFPAPGGRQLIRLVRNASSLEAMLGVRAELVKLNPRGSDPARLYVKAQAGLLSVAGGNGDAFDAHRLVLGVLAVGGRYEGSYIEAGYGRSDVFLLNRYRRVLVTGHLTWASGAWRRRGVRPFLSLFVDGDARGGADSIQTVMGVMFELDRIF